MTKKEDYEQRVENMVQPIVDKFEFELVDVEYVREGGNYFLRVFIDKKNGITIDDCEQVSRELSDLLDEKDFIPDAYILEVSSPGLGRTLKKDKDFARSIGEEVEIKLYKPIDKQKDFVGLLESFDNDKITIRLDEINTMSLERKDIALIRLTIDF